MRWSGCSKYTLLFHNIKLDWPFHCQEIHNQGPDPYNHLPDLLFRFFRENFLNFFFFLWIYNSGKTVKLMFFCRVRTRRISFDPERERRDVFFTLWVKMSLRGYIDPNSCRWLWMTDTFSIGLNKVNIIRNICLCVGPNSQDLLYWLSGNIFFFPNLLGTQLSPYHFSLSYILFYLFSCFPYDNFLLPLSNVFTAQVMLPFQTLTLPTKQANTLSLTHTHENINFATEQKWNYIKFATEQKWKFHEGKEKQTNKSWLCLKSEGKDMWDKDGYMAA